MEASSSSNLPVCTLAAQEICSSMGRRFLQVTSTCKVVNPTLKAVIYDVPTCVIQKLGERHLLYHYIKRQLLNLTMEGIAFPFRSFLVLHRRQIGSN
jgi:hypothetical protein